MTPAEEIEVLKLRKRKLELEQRRLELERLKLAQPSNGESEGEDDSEGEGGTAFDAIQGATRGVTLGFNDVAAGLGAAAGDLYQSTVDGRPRDPEAYTAGVADERARDERSRLRSPRAFGRAELGGALATAPLIAAKPLQAAGSGSAVMGALPAATTAAQRALPVVGRYARAAAGGALGALGFGDVDKAADVPGVAATGALLGAGGEALGALAGSGMQAAPKLVDKGKEALVALLAKGGSRADELRVLTAGPMALKKSVEVPGGVPEVADVFRKTGMSRGVTTANKVSERTAAASEEANRIIKEIIEATDSGGAVVDNKAVAMALRDKAIAIQRDLGGQLDDANNALVERLIAAAQQYDNVGPMTMRGAQTRIAGNADVKGLADTAQFGRRANDLTTSTQGDVAAATVRALRAQMDEAAGSLTGNVPEAITSSPTFARGVPPSGTDLYREARRVSQVSGIADDSVKDWLARTDRNQIFSLGPKLAGAAGAAAAGAPGAAAGMGLAKIGDVFGRSLRATSAETARDLAQRLLKTPSFAQRVGPAAERLRRAMNGPSTLLAQLHDEMMATDPAYRDAVRDEEFRAAVAGGPDEMRRASRSLQ